ncbi:heavy metal-binding domain-containing protein [Hymenobacter sp. H14-R3]|uniref:heavy metal-binding domain-containing protein n=1 Tax=Hymenobacter sp. H14-R3 TaxID=3046308 RepID=UPI0024BA339D|nr:heavy metal-binding domain-containing protein [Hymenobacter sp. H14-R3]MDJ0364755.1 heavy metal-binding domain-containing protein [Hymenobacter sp. H14-R3]
MRKMTTWGLALASLTFAATSCADNKATTETTTTIPAGGAPVAADSLATTVPADNTTVEPAGAMAYTCPMHPEVVSDKPGKCPKCHMDLVKK